MPESLIEQLNKIGDRSEKVRAIADDLKSNTNTFASIDPLELAEQVLEICLEDGSEDWEYSQVAPRQSLDSWGKDDTPVADHIELIFGQISPTREDHLKKQLEEVLAGRKEDDIVISAEERELLETAMTERFIHHGGGWTIQTLRLQGAGNTEIQFEVCVGDAGELTDLLGPYQLAKGETNFSDDLVVMCC